MAFAVNQNNPVYQMTTDKMRGILLGEITNWADVGGRDLPIKVVQVREGGGVEASIESALLKGKGINVTEPISCKLALKSSKSSNNCLGH